MRPMSSWVLIPLLVGMSLWASLDSQACSSFLLESMDRPVVAKNFDMPSGHGLIVVNKRNLSKVAMANGNPVQWISKYGSVTFNQVSRDLPQGGLNEKGLVVEVLMLDPAV